MKSKRRKSWILFFSGGPVPSFYDAVTGDVLPLWRSPWVSESHRDDEDDEGNIPFFHSFFLSFSFFLLLLPLRLWLAATGPVDLIKKIPGIFSWRSSSGGLSFSDTAGNDRTSARRPGGLLSFFFLLSHKSVGMAARPRSRPHSLWLVAGVVTRPQWPMNYHEERRWTFFNSRRNGGENKRKNKQKTRSKGFRNERNGVSKRSLQNRWNRSHKFSFEVESVISLVKKNLVQHSIPERKAIHIIQETKIFC